MKPRQFGPTMRRRCGLAASSMRCCSSLPARRSASPNPAETTTAARQPRAPSSAIRLGHRVGRRREHREIGRDRQLGDRAVVEGRADRLLVRVHGQDRPAKSGLEQVARQHRADRARPVARADQRDRLRLEQRVEVADGHASPRRGTNWRRHWHAACTAARLGLVRHRVPFMTIRPRRSVLYMPGSNARAIEKARTLAADGIILDLEDSVAPDAKAAARDQVVSAVKAGGLRAARGVRPHQRARHRMGRGRPGGGRGGRARLSSWCRRSPRPRQVEMIGQRLLDTHTDLHTRLWVMIETPLAVFNAAAIAACRQGFGDAAVRLRARHQRSRQGDARAHRARPRPDGAVAHVVHRGGAPLRHRHARRGLQRHRQRRTASRANAPRRATWASTARR